MIVAFDGKPVKDSTDLPYMVGSTAVGKSVAVDVLRKGQKKTFQVKIGELKDEKETEAVAEAKPRLGMRVQEITPEIEKNYRLSESSGLVITDVENGSPAAEAGLREGDVILEVDQKPAKGLDEFNRKMESYKPGETVLFLAKRGAGTVFFAIKVR